LKTFFSSTTAKGRKGKEREGKGRKEKEREGKERKKKGEGAAS